MWLKKKFKKLHKESWDQYTSDREQDYTEIKLIPTTF
jgi:hypothetical protein